MYFHEKLFNAFSSRNGTAKVNALLMHVIM